MKKRIISILLAGMMVCSSIPVYAADDLAAYADVSDSADPEEAAGSDAPAEVAGSAGTSESEETEIFPGSQTVYPVLYSGSCCCKCGCIRSVDCPERSPGRCYGGFSQGAMCRISSWR